MIVHFHILLILGFELLMLELIEKKAKIISYCRNNSKVQSRNGRNRHRVDVGAAPKSKRKDRGTKNVDIKFSANDEFLE